MVIGTFYEAKKKKEKVKHQIELSDRLFNAFIAFFVVFCMTSDKHLQDAQKIDSTIHIYCIVDRILEIR